MIFAIISGYIAAALGGLVIGAMNLRRAGALDAHQAHTIRTRLDAFEHALRAHLPETGAQHAAATDHHASAIEKLADAIEKHAAAVDEHGAATVAAAVESRSGSIALPPMLPESKN
jgi:hypothetical protein